MTNDTLNASMNLVSGELVAALALSKDTHTGSSCSNYSLSLPEKIRLQLYSVMCLFVENKIYLVIRFVHAICFHHECIMHM